MLYNSMGIRKMGAYLWNLCRSGLKGPLCHLLTLNLSDFSRPETPSRAGGDPGVQTGNVLLSAQAHVQLQST